MLCIYELSNPLLHAAKIFNHPALGHLAPVRNALFKAFAVVFFLARIVLATYCLSYQGWTCMWVPSYVYWRNNVMFSILQVCRVHACACVRAPQACAWAVAVLSRQPRLSRPLYPSLPRLPLTCPPPTNPACTPAPQCLQFFWFYKIVQIAVSGKASRRGLVDEVAVGAGNQTSAMRAKAA